MIIQVTVEDGAENFVDALRDNLVAASAELMQRIEQDNHEQIQEALGKLENAAIQFSGAMLARVGMLNKHLNDAGVPCPCEKCVAIRPAGN